LRSAIGSYILPWGDGVNDPNGRREADRFRSQSGGLGGMTGPVTGRILCFVACVCRVRLVDSRGNHPERTCSRLAGGIGLAKGCLGMCGGRIHDSGFTQLPATARHQVKTATQKPPRQVSVPMLAFLPNLHSRGAPAVVPRDRVYLRARHIPGRLSARPTNAPG
jgi:hypothetical protein